MSDWRPKGAKEQRSLQELEALGRLDAMNGERSRVDPVPLFPWRPTDQEIEAYSRGYEHGLQALEP